MIYIIDRIEENFLICEDEEKNMINISIELIPFEVKEGEKFKIEDGIYTKLDNQSAEDRIRQKMNRLFK